MTSNADCVPTKDMVSVVAQSAEGSEGAAKLIAMLEDKADNQRINAVESAAVRRTSSVNSFSSGPSSPKDTSGPFS